MLQTIDMLDAVALFLLEYAPGQAEDHLFRGETNRMALPDVQDFTVFGIDSTQRVGTNTGRFAQAADDDDELYSHGVLREYIIKIDFYSKDDKTAAMRATAIETVARSYSGADFFKNYRIGCNYCDDVQYLPYTDLTQQYLFRYRVMLHLTKWEEVTIRQDYANEIVINRVEEINGHHPVQ